jgi:hypothetical protein
MGNWGNFNQIHGLQKGLAGFTKSFKEFTKNYTSAIIQTYGKE